MKTTCSVLTAAYIDEAAAALRALDGHRGAVAQHLGDAVHDLRRVVANADHGVRALLLRMREHQLESFRARPFAQAREKRNVAADERLQRSADGAHDRARA